MGRRPKGIASLERLNVQEVVDKVKQNLEDISDATITFGFILKAIYSTIDMAQEGQDTDELKKEAFIMARELQRILTLTEKFNKKFYNPQREGLRQKYMPFLKECLRISEEKNAKGPQGN